MTRCPACGAELEEGKAYCSNPACGAVPGRTPSPAARQIKIEKYIHVKFKFDFVLLARLAAIVIAGLALAYLFFGVKAPK